VLSSLSPRVWGGSRCHRGQFVAAPAGMGGNMKRLMTGVVAAAMLVPALTACGGDGTQEFFDQIQGTDIDATNPDAVAGAMEDMRDSAPSEIQGDLDTVLDARDQLESDPTAVDMEELQSATDNLTTWEEENCG